MKIKITAISALISMNVFATELDDLPVIKNANFAGQCISKLMLIKYTEKTGDGGELVTNFITDSADEMNVSVERYLDLCSASISAYNTNIKLLELLKN